MLTPADVVAQSGGAFTVVLDAGHGGKDAGAVGSGSKNREKDIALAITNEIGRLLQQNNKDIKVVFTRTTDVFIELGRRAQIANERRISFENIVLDYDSMTVERAGERVVLPQKEFLLLYKLLSYPGKIFTRIQLMDEIWGADSETGWETVTVHIGRLRKRFENWDEFSIESVRGLGYRAVKKHENT